MFCKNLLLLFSDEIAFKVYDKLFINGITYDRELSDDEIISVKSLKGSNISKVFSKIVSSSSINSNVVTYLSGSI